ncbi:MAG: hypothetical protein F6K54_06175 [Okeania sp. SIO3B5]|uniref:hypothetical protein n=1 Tax=Okeania sp. SIO3B5 TaxID=2607811 RepID=UPI00140003AC|nr:hypothetical protein [Okeania sp. SIO3B5]NEO52700.1 hypothetical protein [Okeania sp. SIO3B5]
MTNIIWENWSYQEKPTIPEIGDRTRNYKSESENGFTEKLGLKPRPSLDDF